MRNIKILIFLRDAYEKKKKINKLIDESYIIPIKKFKRQFIYISIQFSSFKKMKTIFIIHILLSLLYISSVYTFHFNSKL